MRAKFMLPCLIFLFRPVDDLDEISAVFVPFHGGGKVGNHLLHILGHFLATLGGVHVEQRVHYEDAANLGLAESAKDVGNQVAVDELQTALK